MSYRETYDMLDRASKRFKIRSDDNAKTTSRTASIANNIQSTDEQNKDSLCANMISEVVKVAAERVNNKPKQRTTSISSVKIDEVSLLKHYLKLH